MKIILFIALFYSGVITIKYVRVKKEAQINYSNYKNCLKALSEYDKDLAKYLEKENKNGY